MSDKVKAIVAHITFIGWLISLIAQFVSGKTPLASFYLRQTLGIFLAGFVLNLIPFRNLSFLLSLVLLGLLIYSVLGAINNERREIPVIGKYFQKWFQIV